MKYIMKNTNAALNAGLVISAVLVLAMLVGIAYTPYDPDAMNGAAKFSAPSFAHLMGTDNFGRDIFSRVLEGLKTTFFVALSVTVIGSFFGVLLGAVTGYFGGVLDEILMRMNDALAAFPSILLALVFISVLGSGKYNIILALGIIFIPSFARIVRGEYIRQKELDYVKSAKLAGAGSFRIMFVHILPNILPALLSAVTVGFNNAVLAEAGMSYLGIGVQPPDASLGRMLSEAQGYLFSAPWYALWPGIVIVLLILGFSLINEGIGEHHA
ncbi:MAG: ABC transporter permease [Lachnospiraceae bacterium]|nr:ABC transporter permease [Lachnospiraceae bacterium]